MRKRTALTQRSNKKNLYGVMTASLKKNLTSEKVNKKLISRQGTFQNLNHDKREGRHTDAVRLVAIKITHKTFHNIEYSWCKNRLINEWISKLLNEADSC